MSDASAEERRLAAPQSVDRVLRILQVLAAAAPAPVGLGELSRSLSSPKSSIAALLRGLDEAGVVKVTDGTARLAAGAFALGGALVGARRRTHSSELVRQGMRRLAELSGETVAFAVADADGTTLTYVEVVESRAAVRFAVAVGDRRPLFCTASGRMLLCARPQAEVDAYLERLEPERFTPRTETRPDALRAIVAAARRDGYAQTLDQAAEGTSGTAALIHDEGGAALGAVLVAAPSARAQPSLPLRAAQVREEALAVSRALGWSGPP